VKPSRSAQASVRTLASRPTLMNRRPAGTVDIETVTQPDRRVGEDIHSRHENGNWILGHWISQ
jgi:hypothetical protein